MNIAHLTNPLVLESKTLWIGDLDTWMDETYIGGIFASTGAVTGVKVIRDKKTGVAAGYGFIDFTSHQAAQEVLIAYHGKNIPGTNKTLKLNWGVFGSTGSKSSASTQSSATPSSTLPTMSTAATPIPGQPEHSIYVGELSPTVDEQVLTEFFYQKYKSVISSKIIIDPVTRQSKGYGFVKFTNFEEAQNAIREMQGRILRGRAIKTSQAHLKSTSGADNTGLGASNLMLNPLLASLTANPMQANPYLMGSGGLPLTGMMGGQALQAPQTYQANYLGMPNLTVMPTMQGYGATPADPALAYSNVARVGVQNPQVYPGYAQPQVLGGYGAQQAGLVSGYGQVTTTPVATQPDGTYYQQFGGYYPQQTAYQPYAGYPAQPQQVMQPQQQYVANQPGAYPYGGQQQQQQQQPQFAQQYSPAHQQHNQPFSGQKAQYSSSKQQILGQNNKTNGTINTSPPVKSQAITVTNLLPLSNQSGNKPALEKMEEEKPEKIMIFNPGYIESNFKFDFIGSEKMKTIF